MTDTTELAINNQTSNKEPGWISKGFNKFASALSRRKEDEKIITKNERALEKMSDIAHKVLDLLESPSFQEKENMHLDSTSGRLERHGNVSVSDDARGLIYSINTRRDSATNEPFMLEVYSSPKDRANYTTGIDDGYFRIFIGKEGKRLIWHNTDVHGDAYLGKETTNIIDGVSVDAMATRVKLKGVSFGGYPTIHVTLNASAKNQDGSFIGPIGEINELHVQGIARAKNPINGHLMDSDTVSVNVSKDFNQADKPFVFDRGEANFQVVKRTDEKTHQPFLAFRFSGIRKRLSGDRNNPTIVGPENQDIAFPMEIANGFTVLNIFEKAIDATIAACKESPKLNSKDH